MHNFDFYNRGILGRLNPRLRKWVMAGKRKTLTNQNFSLLCNNCNGGILSHDLGLQFRSPTVNLFFCSDHFLRFCENFDHYIAQPLVLCREPRRKPDSDYPVCNLGDLEIHFLHYHSFEEAKEKWEARTARLNRENLFVMWTSRSGNSPSTPAPSTSGATNRAWVCCPPTIDRDDGRSINSIMSDGSIKEIIGNR